MQLKRSRPPSRQGGAHAPPSEAFRMFAVAFASRGSLPPFILRAFRYVHVILAVTLSFTHIILCRKADTCPGRANGVASPIHRIVLSTDTSHRRSWDTQDNASAAQPVNHHTSRVLPRLPRHHLPPDITRTAVTPPQPSPVLHSVTCWQPRAPTKRSSRRRCRFPSTTSGKFNIDCHVLQTRMAFHQTFESITRRR